PVSGDALLLERAQPPRHRRSLQPRRGPWVSINAEMTGDGDACLIVDNPGSPSPVTTSPAGSSRSEDWLRTTGSATTVARHPAAARAIRSTAPATAIEGRQPVVGRGQNSRSMRAEPLALNAPTTRPAPSLALADRARFEMRIDIAETLVFRVADVAERLYWLEWQVLRGFPGGWSWRIGAISASCNGPSPVAGARLSCSLFIVLSYGFSAGPRDP